MGVTSPSKRFSLTAYVKDKDGDDHHHVNNREVKGHVYEASIIAYAQHPAQTSPQPLDLPS
jgi:hypothetical protein